MELSEIKNIFIERINKYDKNGAINIVDVQMCKTIQEFLFLIFKDSNVANDLINKDVISSEILVEWFGEETLNEYYIFTTDKKLLFGSKTYIIMGDCDATISNDSDVFSFEHASVTVRQNATLNAYGFTTFHACDNSKVVCLNSPYVKGKFNGRAQGIIDGCNGMIICYEKSSLRASNTTNIKMHDFSHLHAMENVHDVKLFEHSTALLCNNASVECFDDVTVQANGNSTAKLFDNCRASFNENSIGYCNSAQEVTCRDNAYVEICKFVQFTNLYGNSYARIKEMGTKLRAYDNSTVQDFSDIYTEALDNAVIIWMNRHQIFKNQQKYSSNVPFEYTDEQKC